MDAYLTDNGPRLFESDSTILKMANECLVFRNILWKASCTDGFGVLSGRGEELIGELDGADGIERITTFAHLQRLLSTLSTPIGIGAWAIGGGKWATKGINESAS